MTISPSSSASVSSATACRARPRLVNETRYARPSSGSRSRVDQPCLLAVLDESPSSTAWRAAPARQCRPVATARRRTAARAPSRTTLGPRRTRAPRSGATRRSLNRCDAFVQEEADVFESLRTGTAHVLDSTGRVFLSSSAKFGQSDRSSSGTSSRSASTSGSSAVCSGASRSGHSGAAARAGRAAGQPLGDAPLRALGQAEPQQRRDEQRLGLAGRLAPQPPRREVAVAHLEEVERAPVLARAGSRRQRSNWSTRIRSGS